jgi:C1A family cysteine protease
MTQLSRAFGYYGTQKLDNLLGRDVGSTIHGGAKLATTRGIPEETVWPYRDTYDPRPPGGWDAVYEAAAKNRLKRYMLIRNYQDLFDFLGTRMGGASLGIVWNSYCEASGGHIKTYRETRGGGHAICLIGYLRDRVDGRNVLLGANSWGPDYGDRGYMYFYPAAIDAMFGGSYTVCVGLTDMENNGYRAFDLKTDSFI